MNEFWSDHRPIHHEPSEFDGHGRGLTGSRDDATDQYRSIILTTTEQQLELALARRASLDGHLQAPQQVIATQIRMLDEFFYAEDYHQQYVAKRNQRYHCR